MLATASVALAADLGSSVTFTTPVSESSDASKPSPPGGLFRWFNPATAPFIPIPEIDVDPNSGLTLGVIPTWLRNNERQQIDRIIAPDVIYSEYFGWGSRMRVFDYPDADTRWSLVGGLKQRVEREFDGRYLTGVTHSARYSWSIAAVYDRTGTARFYGIGNDTPDSQETSYINEQAFVEVTLGRNFTPQLQLAYVLRWHQVQALHYSLNGLPSIETLFPGVTGLGSEHVLPQALNLTYDTRDSDVIPRHGGRYVAYGGFVSRSLGSSVAYSYCGVDARHYWSFNRGGVVAWHAGWRYMPSAAEAPFWALSSLGGEESVYNEREPLRGVGSDRFRDRNMFGTGVELRHGVANLDAFGTRVDIELTPFVDVGTVYSTGSPLSHLLTAPGIGVRAVASPFIVGFVDVGVEGGKAAVFSGINYPF